MTYEITLRPEARREIKRTGKWYDRKAPGGGRKFLLSLDRCLTSLERDPLVHPVLRGDVRRALLDRYPYGIHFRVGGSKVVVAACCHTRRHPRIWQNRK